MDSLAPIESLLPHRAPMRWIDALIACDAHTATAAVRFPPGHFATCDHGLLEIALVEIVAQTVGAANAWRRRMPGSETAPENRGLGMLAAIGEFEILEQLPEGVTLRIEVRDGKRLGSLLRVTGDVY